MTTNQKTRKASAKAPTPKRRQAKVVTEAQAAALDFKPWEGPIDEGMVPTNEEFIENGLGHLVVCRFALAIMYQTKGEMMERLGELDDDAGCELMDGFIAARGFFSHFVKLLDMAQARIICAG